MRLFLVAFVLLIGYEGFSQPIQMHKTLGGAHFQRDTIYLSHRHVAEILSVDPAASLEFKQAVKDYRVGGLLGFSGAILLAIPVITAISGGDPEWLMAGGGAILLGVSVPFSRGFKRHAGAALDGYNSRHEQATSSRIYFTGNGITLKF
jgi:hypothetical protein